MTPFGTITSPDNRIMERLAMLLRGGAGVIPFITAGRALANAVMVSRGQSALPRWAHLLADAMLGALIVVQRDSDTEDDPDRRIQLATAAAVLAMVRPHAAHACNAAIHGWLGFGLAPAHCHDSPEQLAARALHLLRLDDTDAAADTVHELVDHGGAAAGWVLHDWMVSRVQGHGLSRETLCFHNLRLALIDGGSSTTGLAQLQLLAALVVIERADREVGDALGWLDQVAAEIREEGTSSLAATA